MRKPYLFFPLFFLAFFMAAGAAVMWLWNAILPEVISVRPVSYWQALGILALTRLLTGGGGRWRTPGKGTHPREKWMHLNDEERQRLKTEWQRRCGINNSRTERDEK